MGTAARMITAAAGFAALLVAGVVVAEAQNAPAEVIKQRQEMMKANGAAAKTLADMMKGEKPYSQDAAHQAAVTINANSKKIPSMFPAGSGTEAGVKTGALPAIWQNKADFDAKSKKLEEESAKLVAANDEAAVKAQFGNVGKACGGCHETYRSKEK
ncbi:MAG TPA: cytochrome c [Alphaproteobacteria bacterium]|nr:cytochrome c [Alphaproteobacteria bacterium]